MPSVALTARSGAVLAAATLLAISAASCGFTGTNLGGQVAGISDAEIGARRDDPLRG